MHKKDLAFHVFSSLSSAENPPFYWENPLFSGIWYNESIRNRREKQWLTVPKISSSVSWRTSILENKIEEALEQSQTVQEHNLIKKKRDKLKADIVAQTRNFREADGSIKRFIQEDLQNLAEELRKTEQQLSKLDEGRKNNMIAIRDLEMTNERLLSFAE